MRGFWRNDWPFFQAPSRAFSYPHSSGDRFPSDRQNRHPAAPIPADWDQSLLNAGAVATHDQLDVFALD